MLFIYYYNIHLFEDFHVLVHSIVDIRTLDQRNSFA